MRAPDATAGTRTTGPSRPERTTAAGEHDAAHYSRWRQVLLLAGIALVAANLRPIIGSLGPVLGQVRDTLQLSGTLAGLLTTLPVLCFAACGAAAPTLAARVGSHRLTAAAMTALAAGLAVRATTGSTTVFLLASLVALAGVGFANVLTPALVKQHFPHRLRQVTGIYATTMQVGMMTSSAVSVPLAHAFGDWRESLGIWAILAVLATLPWLGLLRTTRLTYQAGNRVTGRQLIRSRTAWALAVFFGIQSGQAYALFGWLPAILGDAGVSSGRAGVDLSIIAAMGVVTSILLPAVSTKLRSFWPLVVGIASCYAVGYVGLLLAPAAAPWLWAMVLGAGGGAFPLALMLIGLRARTGQATSALSGFAQGTGYLVAALGPFLVGFLHDLTGEWTLSVLFLLATVCVLLPVGLIAARHRYVEDEIR
ncbi:MAG: CynX/NimT family MFS transporter [Streptosporangiales bacterium]